MGWRWPIILSVLAVVAGLYLSGAFSDPPDPPPLGDGWWGVGRRDKAVKEDESIRKFTISISNDTIKDLKHRLRNTRYFEGIEGTKFHYGVRPEYMQTVVKYWLDGYDFKAQEKYFNKYDHYITNIEGIDLHFVHVKPKLKPGQKSRPLLISHGWPGSFYEFHKLIPLLTDPLNHGGSADDIFEVICPSIPGYGYSEAAHKTGMNAHAVARIFGKLMSRLGHDRYYVQGGDWGATITLLMGLILPDHVIGLHINLIIADPPMHIPRVIIGSLFPSLILPAKDHHKIWPAMPKFYTMLQETGYFHIQATKPDTIGHSLTDSPVGLAAYILEKFSTATNKSWRGLEDGGLNDGWEIDDLLNNIMVYWLNGNIASAMRFYKENLFLFTDDTYSKCQVKVPTGAADFPNDIGNSPESWVRYKFPNLIQYNSMPRGGHFAAMEEPQLLAEDIRLFVQKVEAL